MSEHEEISYTHFSGKKKKDKIDTRNMVVDCFPIIAFIYHIDLLSFRVSVCLISK